MCDSRQARRKGQCSTVATRGRPAGLAAAIVAYPQWRRLSPTGYWSLSLWLRNHQWIVDRQKIRIRVDPETSGILQSSTFHLKLHSLYDALAECNYAIILPWKHHASHTMLERGLPNNVCSRVCSFSPCFSMCILPMVCGSINVHF